MKTSIEGRTLMPQSIRLILVSVVLIALIGATTGFADVGAQKVSLKFHPTVGQKTTYETTTISETESKGMPGLPAAGQKQTMTQVVEQTQTVKAQKPNGNYLIELSFGQESMQVGDTQVPSGILEGKVFTMEMSPEGKLLDIQGIDDLQLGMKQTIQNMIQQTGGSFVFPQRDVAVGETWQASMETKWPIGITGGVVSGEVVQKTSCDYTLVGVESMEGVLAAKISMKMKIEQKSTPESKMMQVQATGTGEGMLYYDYQHSKVLSSNLTTTINMSNTINPPPGRSGQSFTTQHHVVTRTTMKIKK